MEPAGTPASGWLTPIEWHYSIVSSQPTYSVPYTPCHHLKGTSSEVCEKENTDYSLVPPFQPDSRKLYLPSLPYRNAFSTLLLQSLWELASLAVVEFLSRTIPILLHIRVRRPRFWIHGFKCDTMQEREKKKRGEASVRCRHVRRQSGHLHGLSVLQVQLFPSSHHRAQGRSRPDQTQPPLPAIRSSN